MKFYDRLKILKENKKAISITVRSQNLDYLKNYLEEKKIEIPISAIFDMLLEDCVKELKQETKK